MRLDQVEVAVIVAAFGLYGGLIAAVTGGDLDRRAIIMGAIVGISIITVLAAWLLDRRGLL